MVRADITGFAAAPRIAYFSMEVGVSPAIPTYAGGLGVLAGDILRSAADLNINMIGVTLLYRAGYFHQEIDSEGCQREHPVRWDPQSVLTELPLRVEVHLEGRPVVIRGWRYEIEGVRGMTPVFFLDTDLPENAPEHRALTGALYGGSTRYRVMQEIVLGIGGVRLLRALGYAQLHRFHMNEGHAAFLGLELFHQLLSHGMQHRVALDAVRRQGVFTTHTPIEAGHDRFSLDLVGQLLEPALLRDLHHIDSLRPCIVDGVLNMTRLGAAVSHFVNAVSQRHAKVSQLLFPDLPLRSITNGVHTVRWAHPEIAKLFDRHLAGWREDPAMLRRAPVLPLAELERAHRVAKGELCMLVEGVSGVSIKADRFVIGVARRATAYKRLDLLFEDTDRLGSIAEQYGGLSVIISGKAHPHDGPGREMIQRLVRVARDSSSSVQVVFIPDYSLAVAESLVRGVDLWLNTPSAPLEASGTSGMKAAVNGIPSLSTLDGWWLEGWIEGMTGWAIGPDRCADLKGVKIGQIDHRAEDSAELYRKLELILELYHRRHELFLEIMRHTIALNASHFHSQRVVEEYTSQAYL